MLVGFPYLVQNEVQTFVLEKLSVQKDIMLCCACAFAVHGTKCMVCLYFSSSLQLQMEMYIMCAYTHHTMSQNIKSSHIISSYGITQRAQYSLIKEDTLIKS